jgi:MFS family permease
LIRYKDGISSMIKTRLSNSYLIGEIFGMLFFGVLIDRVGRTTGVVAATVLLVLGIVLATAAHGTSELECARQQVQKPPEKRLT